jgi:hypothetical protein
MMDNVAYLTRIKDEPDLIYWNMLYHYNIGIRNFYVMFNRSSQPTRTLVERFVARHKDIRYFPLEDPATAYMQREMFEQMANMALNNGHKWQIPVDADELLYLKGITLKELIDRYDAQYDHGFIQLDFVNYHPTSENNDESIKNYFLRWKWRERGTMCGSIYKVIWKWNKSYLCGHGHHLISAKNGVRKKEIAVMDQNTAFIAHFPARSFEQIRKKKIRICEAFVETSGDVENSGQVSEYRQWKEKGEQFWIDMWSKIQKDRIANFQNGNYVFDPIPKNLFSI